VREALISLDREGLVHTIPRKGSYVSRIDRDDIADHYQIFGQVAGLAAARAVARVDEAEMARLVDLHEQMSAADSLQEQQRLNHEFHRTINQACGSQRMTSMIQLLSRSLPMPYVDFPPEWLEEANRQHRDILDAFRRRDTLAAQRSMEQHINASARHAIEVLEHLDFFEDE
jgi:DNA-binding GntR family transcriptional regulator